MTAGSVRLTATAALLGVILTSASCSAPAYGQEAVLRQMFRPPPGERVDRVVRAPNGYFVLGRGRSLARFDKGKPGVLPDLGERPVPETEEAGETRRIVDSRSGTGIGQLRLFHENGERQGRFEVLKQGGVVDWSAPVPPASSVHLSDDAEKLVVVAPEGHGPGASSRTTLVRRDGTAYELAAGLPGVTSVHMSRAGDRIAVGALDGRVRVYDDTGAEQYAVPGGEGLLSENGGTLVVLQGRRPHVYVNGADKQTVRMRNVARAAAMTPNGLRACVISENEVHLIDVATGKDTLLNVPLQPNEQLRSVAMADAPLRIVLGSLIVKTRPRVDAEGEADALVRVVTPQRLDPPPQVFPTKDWTSRQPEIRLSPAGDGAVVITGDSVQWLEFRP